MCRAIDRCLLARVWIGPEAELLKNQKLCRMSRGPCWDCPACLGWCDLQQECQDTLLLVDGPDLRISR